MGMATTDRKLGNILTGFANSKDLKRALKTMRIRAKRIFPEISETTNENEYKDNKQKLRKLFNELITLENLKDSKFISGYIQSFNKHCTSKIYINKNVGKIESRYFYRDAKKIKYDDLLVFSIIHFLQNFKVNKQYLRKCNFKDCGRYFLSKQKGPRVKNCPVCRNKGTYTPEERKKYNIQRKIINSREKLKSEIMDLVEQGYKLDKIKLTYDDDGKIQKLIKKSEWSIDLAYEAAMKELKKKNGEKALKLNNLSVL